MESAYESVVIPGNAKASCYEDSIIASLVHLRRDDVHQNIKPYRLQYHPGKDVARTNCANETRQGIPIHNVRNHLGNITFDKNGFDLLYIRTALEGDDFYNKDRVREVFYGEVKSLLSNYFETSKLIIIMEHQIRKRHPAFPISIGGDYDRLQPTTVAHIDFTLGSALEASRDVLKINNDEYNRIQCINLWKPLRGPVTDWPLALCDAQTLNEAHDCIALDVVTRTGYTENCQIYYNENQKWYYLSEQMDSEMWIFRQTDTAEEFSTGVAHTGFYNPEAHSDERPRESIEVRAFVYY